MRLSPRAAAISAIALVVLLAIGLYWTDKQRNPTLPETPGEATADEAQTPERDLPQQVGQIRLSDDADAKSGDFWLEQAFTFSNTADAERWLQLFAGVDGTTLSGLRVTLGERGVQLERVTGRKAETIAAGTLDLSVFEHERFALGKVNEAVEATDRRNGGLTNIVVTPDVLE